MAQTTGLPKIEDWLRTENKDMKTLRKTTKDDFEKMLLETKLGLNEHQAHVISGMMSEYIVQEAKANGEGIRKLYDELSVEYESTRNHYREHVETLQSGTKRVMESLSKQGMVHFETNPKTKRRDLKCRTVVLKAVVDFLNSVDEEVLDFFENIYQIEPDGKVQTSLFPQEFNNLEKKT